MVLTDWATGVLQWLTQNVANEILRKKLGADVKLTCVRIVFWNSLTLNKAESLVIVNKNVTVKRYLSFAQTARHALGVG